MIFLQNSQHSFFIVTKIFQKSSEVDLDRELQRFQVHTAADAEPSANMNSRARLPAKRKIGSAGDGNFSSSSRFKNFRGKITNSHLPQPPH